MAYGHGIAERETDECREERGAQGVEVGVAVHLVGEQVLVVRGAQGELHVVVRRAGEDVREGRHARRHFSEADFQRERERHEKENQQEQQRRQDDEPAA